jgi:hypothetical protein
MICIPVVTLATHRLMKKILAAAFLVSLAALSPAADKEKRVKFAPPTGFAGHEWGERRTTFDRLPETPVGVGAAWMHQVEKQSNDFTCVPAVTAGAQITGAVGGCDFQQALLSLRKSFEGGGTYVLSEYSIPEQGFRFGDENDGIVLHPVVYQFCANWNGASKKRGEAPPDFDALNKFCGVRFMFESESREELRGKPDDYVTNYDRMVGKLRAKFGEPDGYLRRGRVLIETLEGDSTDESERKFSIWRWCPARGEGLHTDCTASVVLTLDPATGVGTVLYSTPLLWEYAYAREHYGFKGDRLFKMLHAKN